VRETTRLTTREKNHDLIKSSDMILKRCS